MRWKASDPISDGNRNVTRLYINHDTATEVRNASSNGLVQAVSHPKMFVSFMSFFRHLGTLHPERATPQAKRQGVQSPRSEQSLFDESGPTRWLNLGCHDARVQGLMFLSW